MEKELRKILEDFYIQVLQGKVNANDYEHLAHDLLEKAEETEQPEKEFIYYWE